MFPSERAKDELECRGSALESGTTEKHPAQTHTHENPQARAAA